MKKLDFNNHKNIIGAQLKHQRLARHLTQKDLAAKMQTMNVNIDQQMISKIEKGKRIVTDYELACFCHLLQTDEKTMLADFYEMVNL